MKKVIFIAPHPDDETLGCGGAILKHIDKGDEVFWLIMTTIEGSSLYSKKQVKKRTSEIDSVASKYGFKEVIKSDFLTAQLDTYPKKELIEFISNIFNRIQPDIIYTPYENDAHSDHKAVFLATVACCKSFRYPFISSVRVYETLSETELNLSVDNNGFKPNLWIDISDFLEKKIEIMQNYSSEMGHHPFPRSEENIRALATLRGSSIAVKYAEAYISIKEVIL